MEDNGIFLPVLSIAIEYTVQVEAGEVNKNPNFCTNSFRLQLNIRRRNDKKLTLQKNQESHLYPNTIM